MGTDMRPIRQGLPRWPGGEAWPPAGDALVAAAAPGSEADAPEQSSVISAPAPATASPLTQESATGPTETEPVAAAAPAGGTRPIRRGLPRRVPGSEPWPPAGAVDVPATASVSAAAPHPATSTPDARLNTAGQAPAAAATPADSAGPTATIPAGAASDRPLRRGLPRVKGSEPLPAAGTAAAITVTKSGGAPSGAKDELAPAAAASAPTPIDAAAQPVHTQPPRPTTSARPTTPATLPAQARSAPTATPVPARGTGRFGAYTRKQLLGFAVIGAFAVLGAATVVVVAAAWFRNLPFMQDFLTAYPGEYDLPGEATPGFPAWVRWQHFFNVFLMVLIIRSGLQVRNEKRPGAFWTPKWSKDGKGKISLSLWFHQALDILWLVNGGVFVVLLFVTGHWMRIVPTSWDVFPNAFSALLQYMSLNWPTENGWVNYNSLQQLMYFLTVFVAAPLAAITGVRMSELWPKNTKALNRAYPVEWARAVHFPVMLYFTAFIIVHVALVFATGALRNLNHMYGGTDVINWAGFWIFFVSLLIIVGGWIAARPLVLAPIAKLSGKVTGR
jgi:thiosulfate reductase cytochrome b subunit